jgi:3-hydroxybutyryl-CoA dehydratase
MGVPKSKCDLVILTFEDLRVGDRWISDRRIVSTGEIKEFADLTGDFTPIHVDEEYALETPFRGIIAHGLLGLSLLAGLSTEAPRVDTVALVDISGWRFRNPLYVGDEIHVVTEVAAVADHGRRYGQVQWYRKLINQKGEIVQDGMLSTIVKRRVILSTKSPPIIEGPATQVVPEPHSPAVKESIAGSLSL